MIATKGAIILVGVQPVHIIKTDIQYNAFSSIVLSFMKNLNSKYYYSRYGALYQTIL